MPRLVKIVTYAPIENADAVREAIGKAGAGKIGNYTYCTFSSVGTGRFKPEVGANPTVGEVGKLEAVPEERIETVCEFDKVKEVITAIKKVHIYEEVPIDIYPLEVVE